jgi:hypothetical protein
MPVSESDVQDAFSFTRWARAAISATFDLFYNLELNVMGSLPKKASPIESWLSQAIRAEAKSSDESQQKNTIL